MTTSPVTNPLTPGSPNPASSPYNANLPPTTVATPSGVPTVAPVTPPPVTPAATPPPAIPVTPATPVVPPTPNGANTVPVGTGTGNTGGTGATPSAPNPTVYTDPNGQTYTLDSNGNQVYTASGSTGNPNVDALAKSYADQAAAAKTFGDAVTNIENGTTPLNPGEQAQIDGLKAQFQQLIDKQTVINTSNTGTAQIRGYQTGTAEFDRSFQSKTIGDIMSAGANQIATLQTQEASAVASLTQSLQNNDISQMKTAYDAYTDAAAATQKGLETVISETQQAFNDAHIQNVMASGLTDPKDILAQLQKEGYTDISADDISKTIADLSPDSADIFATAQAAAKNGAPPDVLSAIMNSPDKATALATAGVYNTSAISDISTQAAKFGAPQSVLDAISKATTEGDAISAAAGYLQDPTSTGGMYSAYVAQTQAAGGIPMSAGDFVANQKYSEDLAAAKASNAYSYSNAYNVKAAQDAADAQFSGSDANQQKLEKDYSTTLLKELSNRSGGLGLQDQKVNQAIHLNALVNQYATTDASGNVTYNIPTAQYGELVLGLANLLSASGSTSDADRQTLMSKTGSGDLKGALQYITGTPQNGNTQAIISNLVDSINRQGEVAQDLRDQDVALLQGLAPTDLDPDRKAALEQNLLPSFTDKLQNTVAAQAQAKSIVNTYTANNPKMIDKITQALQIPGMNDALLIEYMKNPSSGFDNYGDLP